MMKRTINLLLMLLFVAEVTFANMLILIKYLKEELPVSKNKIKRTSFPETGISYN